MEQERSVPLWNKPTRKKTHAVVLGLVSASPLFSTYGSEKYGPRTDWSSGVFHAILSTRFFTHITTVTVIYNFNLTANSTLVLPYDVV